LREIYTRFRLIAKLPMVNHYSLIVVLI